MSAVRKEFPQLNDESVRIKGLEGAIKNGSQVTAEDLMPSP